jgi:CHASE1-domain containing sensor protein
MTLFSILLLGLLSMLVLAVSAGVLQLRRQAVGLEALAEAAGSLVDAKVSEAERDAQMLRAVEESERFQREEEETKPDHPRPLLASCSRCGLTIGLCHCKRAS